MHWIEYMNLMHEKDGTVEKITKEITDDYADVLKRLGEGPNGEYVHELEKRLAEAYVDIKRIRKERDDALRRAHDAANEVKEGL
ncbi:MAG: hypothetical protein DRI84_07930 [Bacteroidetes bacterium]|nr:MAG: hypothetical protein DRI84_07930 [Bacteroidota bacterium]